MDTVGQLRDAADHALLSGDHAGALWRYTLVLRAQPGNLDARLRLGDALLALGEVQRAAEVYAAFARHTALIGHPLRALVALLVLRTLDPQLGTLLDGVARRYGLRAPTLGRSARPGPGDPDQPLPDGLSDLADGAPPETERLVAEAASLGQEVDGLGHVPDRVPPIPLFSLLPEQAFASVLRALRLVRARPGDVILTQGQPGEAFYVIARGQVAVRRREPGGAETHLADLYEGAIFGEMALLSAAPRTATVTATKDTDLLEFGREALAAAADELDVLARALDQFTRDRMVQNVLRSSPMFRPLDDGQRRDLFKRFTTLHLEAGVDVLSQGHPGSGLFLLLSGAVEVVRDPGDGTPPVTLAELGPGELFGELSALQDVPVSATVRTKTPSAVLFLAREIVARLVAGIPAIGAYVEGLAEQRVLDTEQALAADEIEVDVEL